MVFTRRLRDGVRSGRIRCSIRIWQHPHVKAGGYYAMEEGRILVSSIDTIRRKDITSDLARESGFDSVKDLLDIAKHGPGENIYLIRFRYLPPGAWDVPQPATNRRGDGGSKTELLDRIRSVRSREKPKTRSK